MPKHILDTYRDDGKWIVYCKICSKENPPESEECSGKFVDKKIDNKQEHN